MKRFKGKISEDYDINSVVFPGYDGIQKKIGEIVKEHFKSLKGVHFKVLEIGTGTGLTSKEILNADSRISLTTIDNEDSMITQAYEKLHRYSIRLNRLKIINYSALPFLEEKISSAYHAVVSGNTLHNIQQRERKKISKEIHRVLIPDGLFVNGDKYAMDDPESHELSFDYTKNKLCTELQKMNKMDLCEEWMKHYEFDNQPGYLMKESESIQELRKIGFKDPYLVYRDQMLAVVRAIKCQNK